MKRCRRGGCEVRHSRDVQVNVDSSNSRECGAMEQPGDYVILNLSERLRRLGDMRACAACELGKDPSR